MHWLPLVAMVIASALPFPHNPVSSAAVPTAQPGSDRRDPAVDYSLRGNASQTDFGAAAAASQRDRPNLRNQKDYAKTSAFKLENQVSYQPQRNSGSDDKAGVSLDVPAEGGALRTEDVSEDNSLSKDYKANRQSSSKLVDFSEKDSADAPLKVQNPDSASSATTLKGQREEEPSESSDHLRHASVRTESQQTPGTRTGPAEGSLTTKAGDGTRMDSFLEGDELFLDAHPRVLFSPSPSPPEHPPLLLMLENDLLGDDGDGEEQEDADGRIEGHGDRAIDRSATLSLEEQSGAAGKEAVHPVKRDKRSQLMERRRGALSVCQSESFWVNNKETGIDSNGQNVTILKEVQTQLGPIRQYFYETRCRQAEQSHGNRTKGAAGRSLGTGVDGGGCLGVDKKQWQSKCESKDSYVRALTRDGNNKTGWRWIRIYSACVCVLLPRRYQGRGVLAAKGGG